MAALLLAVTVPSVLQREDLYREVATDVNIQKIIHQLEEKKLESKKYMVIDKKLWSKKSLVIPHTSEFIPLILKECHDSKTGGHSRVMKTLHMIQRSFAWQGIKKYVQNYVAGCDVFQTHKHSTFSPAGLLQPLHVLEKIWEDINIDFIEGLQTLSGVNVILVVIERLSKAAHFLYLKHLFTAVDVAHQFVAEIVRLHGNPKSVVSDRDRIFLSNFWNECFKLVGTALKYSTLFHPQTDVQPKVLNRCLETYMRCYASSHPPTWSKYLCWE